MKKILASLLILFGLIFIVISILGLIKAFDLFSNSDTSSESIGYSFGSIIFPLLLTVTGRWMLRKGIRQIKAPKKTD